MHIEAVLGNNSDVGPSDRRQPRNRVSPQPIRSYDAAHRNWGKPEVEPGFMKVKASAEGRRMIEAELQSGDDE